MEKFSYNSITGPTCETENTTGEIINDGLLIVGVCALLLAAGMFTGGKRLKASGATGAQYPAYVGVSSLALAAARILLPA